MENKDLYDALENQRINQDEHLKSKRPLENKNDGLSKLFKDFNTTNEELINIIQKLILSSKNG